jgi:hypothetical protein
MSYSKFKLKDSGKVFYYRNLDNSIHNNSGEILSLPPKEGFDFFEKIFKTENDISHPLLIIKTTFRVCSNQ